MADATATPSFWDSITGALTNKTVQQINDYGNTQAAPAPVIASSAPSFFQQHKQAIMVGGAAVLAVVVIALVKKRKAG